MELLNKEINGYKIIDFIGQGGFGSVYKAEKNRQNFAIKIFREAYVLDELRKGVNNRITREIKVMQNIQHHFLVEYIEHFFKEVSNIPQVFLIMEYINGETLYKKIKKGSVVNAENIFIKILEGLKALHAKNIIHRDLKPENIMVQENGDIKILDYGLSKLIDYTSITSTGNILGTYAYMSPEQITDSKYIDFKSDLYSAGMIFYEMLTGQLAFSAKLVPEFIDKIKNEPPTPPRKWNSNINNRHEDIILKLLEKDPYKRYSNIDDILLELSQKNISKLTYYDLSIRFILHAYNEKSVIETFINDHPEKKLYINFPINHHFRQTGLLNIISKDNNIVMLSDPATIRLAYDTYSDVDGLCRLPYCPKDYSVITPDSLLSYDSQREYVKQVMDEQVKIKADIITSPYHYSHNTNIVPTAKRNPVAEWFDLDVKLLKEAIEYRNNTPHLKDKPLYAGICINAAGLTDKQYRLELLNTYVSMKCDGFIIYADGISKETTEIMLYNYILTLLNLQKYAEKPVIAGRLDMLGLGLICAGITGFTSGAARFESFYEDLYKIETDVYNMYERYYFPSLLGTIAITKKDPVRLQQIIKTIGSCDCRYCKGKIAPDLIEPKNNKLHFLELIHQEIDNVSKINGGNDRIDYFVKRVEEAENNYKKLGIVFKPSDYSHLRRWRKVFSKIGEQNVQI